MVQNIVSRTAAMPSDPEREKAQRQALLLSKRISTATVVEPVKYALSVDGTGFFALSDLSGVKGKQKSGKSSVFKVCASALMSGSQFRVTSELESPKALFLDTEQQAADVKQLVDDVSRMSGMPDGYVDDHLFVYTLRRMSYDTLVDDTRFYIDYHRPQVVFIDGVVDYVASFNDEVMSRKLIKDLMVMCEEYCCAIVCVLHENKAIDDANMRGHLGTVLGQKAGTVLQCQKQGAVIRVSCSDARHGSMPEWSIMFDQDGHLCPADEMQALIKQQRLEQASRQLKEKNEANEKERLNYALELIRDNGGSITQSVLKKKLEEKAGVKGGAIYNFLNKMYAKKSLLKNDDMVSAPDELALPY